MKSITTSRDVAALRAAFDALELESPRMGDAQIDTLVSCEQLLWRVEDGEATAAQAARCARQLVALAEQTGLAGTPRVAGTLQLA
jgi:hypothetical protein